MFTMALMAAMSGAPDVAGFGWGNCTGSSCCGGAVVVSSGCSGSSCCGGFSSCYGSSCCGGGGGLLGLGLLSRLRGGSGCCGGSCYSSSCHSTSCYSSSCYSSCRGSSCYSSSCHGSGCYSSGCTGFSYPAYAGGCTGLSTGVSYGVPSYSVPAAAGCGCCGTTGGAVWYGPDFHSGGNMAPPIIGSSIVGSSAPVVSVPTVTIDRSKEYQAAKSKPAAAPARLTLDLPATAVLSVDGSVVKGEGVTRTFHTPDLATGRTFYYDLKAEITVDGKTVTEERRVLVTAGDAVNESFGKLIAAAKSGKTEVAKK